MISLLITALIITAIVYWFNRFLPFKICALCAGVSGAWLLATFGILAGFLKAEALRLPILIMMGGTAVGIAFQGQEKLSFAKKSIWHWKIPSALIGLGIFYWFFLKMSWLTFIIEVILLGFLVFVFFIRQSAAESRGIDEKIFNQKLKEIEENLRKCC
jgi:hypothetical protein